MSRNYYDEYIPPLGAKEAAAEALKAARDAFHNTFDPTVESYYPSCDGSGWRHDGYHHADSVLTVFAGEQPIPRHVQCPGCVNCCDQPAPAEGSPETEPLPCADCGQVEGPVPVDHRTLNGHPYRRPEPAPRGEFVCCANGAPPYEEGDEHYCWATGEYGPVAYSAQRTVVTPPAQPSPVPTWARTEERVPFSDSKIACWKNADDDYWLVPHAIEEIIRAEAAESATRPYHDALVRLLTRFRENAADERDIEQMRDWRERGARDRANAYDGAANWVAAALNRLAASRAEEVKG